MSYDPPRNHGHHGHHGSTSSDDYDPTPPSEEDIPRGAGRDGYRHVEPLREMDWGSSFQPKSLANPSSPISPQQAPQQISFLPSVMIPGPVSRHPQMLAQRASTWGSQESQKSAKSFEPRRLHSVVANIRGHRHEALAQDEDSIPLATLHETDISQARDKTLEDDSDDEYVGFDIGAYAGGPAMFTPMVDHNTNDYVAPHHQKYEQRRREMETEVPEPQTPAPGFSLEDIGFGGGLGAGMVGATMTVPPSFPETQATFSTSRSNSGGLTRRGTLRDVGIARANETGHMVAVYETQSQAFDEPFHPESAPQNPFENHGKANGVSFLFPDYQAPNWRPFTMRWWYLSFLILLSLTLAGVQEFMYQKSRQYPLPPNKCDANLATICEHRSLDPSLPPPPPIPKTGLLSFQCANDVPTHDYFLWKYSPTIVTVIYGVFWQVVDFDIKRLEPFYQLSREYGALAGESLNIDYISGISFLAPLTAFRYQQWAVVLSSIAALLAGTVSPPIQSASLRLQRACIPDKHLDFNSVYIDSVWSRITTVTFVLTAVLGAVLLVIIQTRKTGLQSDPKGVAGLAAMANKSWILVDFKDLDRASENDLHNRLRMRRYILRNSTIWQGEQIKERVDDAILSEKSHPHPLIMQLKAGIPLMAYLVLVLVLIPVLLNISSGKSLLPPSASWVFTAMAVVVRLLWIALEQGLRMLEPFYRLSRRDAPHTALTTDYRGTIPGVLIFKALFNKDFLLAVVAANSVFTEILTVTLTSISRSANKKDETTNTTFITSLVLSMAILASLIFTSGAVYLKRRHPFLPRQPSTIASVFAYIHQSHLLYDFVDTETFNSSQMTKHLAAKKKTYGIGWFKGRDKRNHCGIEEEPRINKSYRFKDNYLEATDPWADDSAYHGAGFHNI